MSTLTSTGIASRSAACAAAVKDWRVGARSAVMSLPPQRAADTCPSIQNDISEPLPSAKRQSQCSARAACPACGSGAFSRAMLLFTSLALEQASMTLLKQTWPMLRQTNLQRRIHASPRHTCMLMKLWQATL